MYLVDLKFLTFDGLSQDMGSTQQDSLRDI